MNVSNTYAIAGTGKTRWEVTAGAHVITVDEARRGHLEAGNVSNDGLLTEADRQSLRERATDLIRRQR